MSFILSKTIVWSEFQISQENRYFKFDLSQIIDLSPQRTFVEQNFSFLLQFAVTGNFPHFWSDHTQTTTINEVRAFILA